MSKKSPVDNKSLEETAKSLPTSDAVPENTFVSPVEPPGDDLNQNRKKDSVAPTTPKKLQNKRFWLKISLPVIILLIVTVVIVGRISYKHWYNESIKPLSSVQQRIVVKIKPGMTARTIGQVLEDSKVIKSGDAFYIYTKDNGQRGNLQAGTYMFSPNQSVAQIVSMLVSGKTNIFNVTILPGQTLQQIKDQLLKDGYKDSEITAAFAKKYNSPLFNGRPSGASLEGYIFPDTYQIDGDTSVSQLLQKSFDNFYQKLQTTDILTAVKSHNLNLYQAITLASIIQKEDSDSSVQPQIAQVFLLRLQKGMVLGSDVTAIYGARIAGQDVSPAAAVAYDSPYNTRLHHGLPPGPVANFNLSSLQAVAHPASGDYLFFVAGDDSTVHFARTEKEHQQNVDNYCKKLCQ
jgi:UPF0755 protein